ncbi:MAG: Na(+)/H(+) antiporter subunit D [bacterium]|nr:Na(+)/H(+) antiporter subunit D [bacterium]
MTNWIIPPAFIMMIGAVLLPMLPKKIRSAAFVFITFSTLVSVFLLPYGEGAEILTAKVMNYDLVLCQADKLSRVFGIIFAFICMGGGIYAFHIKDTGQQVAALLYAGGALGVTFAGDFFTLFIFWEMMALGSTYLIWARRTPESWKAGTRYLLYHVLGGGILFAGLLMHIYSQSGNILITELKPDNPASWLVLLGVLINAAVPPMHTWLADAYPKATVTGAVFLSAFTTKTAVYVLARVFPGWEVLLILGVIMTLYGVIFAVLANDIRGILAYHIISQVGYMVAGIGIGTEMAINGATAHAFSHILYKALLFMGAGAVLYSTGKSKLTDLGGLYRKMPVTFWLYMVAAFSISGFPLFNGFISKSMTVAAADEKHITWAFFLMILAAVGTFLSVGLKLPYFTWFAKDNPPKDMEVRKVPVTMHIGMALAAGGCILHGIAPGLLYKWLPYAVNWNPFTAHHLVETVQILVFTFIVFWLMRGIIQPKAKATLDLDWLYRMPAKAVRKVVVDPFDVFFIWCEDKSFEIADKLCKLAKNPYTIFSTGKKDVEYSPDNYRPPTRKMVMAIIMVFILVVILISV